MLYHRFYPFKNPEYPEVRQNPVVVDPRGNRLKRKESFVKMQHKQYKPYLVTGPNNSFYIANTTHAM